jgi:hypothetical protein
MLIRHSREGLPSTRVQNAAPPIGVLASVPHFLRVFESGMV